MRLGSFIGVNVDMILLYSLQRYEKKMTFLLFG